MNSKLNSLMQPIKLAIIIVFAVIVASIIIYFNKKQNPFAALRHEIRIGITQEPLAALWTVAADTDLFRQNGINVTSRKSYSSGKLALQGLRAGEVDVVVAAEVPIILEHLQGAKLRILATIGTSVNDVQILARRQSEITSPGDLRGKTIGTHPGSAVHFFTYLFLLKQHIPPSQITLKYLSPEELVKEFGQGKIDAFVMREPFISQAQDIVGKDATILFTEPSLYRKTMNVTTTTDFLEKNSEIVPKILTGLFGSEEFMRTNFKNGVDIVAKDLKSKQNAISLALKDADLRVRLDEALLTALEEQAKWAIDSKLVDPQPIPNVEDLIFASELAKIRPESVHLIQ